MNKENKKESKSLKNTERINESKEKVAIILIRGRANINKDIIDTLDMLHLHRKHFCSVYEKTPVLLGMLRKVKDYVTWGEITEDNYKQLKEKRGEKSDNKLKPFFRMAPPRGGFERGGIKKPYSSGGVLGYRREKINDLILRMI